MRVFDLDEEVRLERRLSATDRKALAAIRRRRDLERSPFYRSIAAEVEALTRGLEFARPPSAAARPARRFLRAVTWNIERGNRLDAIRGFFAEQPALRDCDVVLLNEVDVGMARSGNRDVARELAAALGFEHVFGNSYLVLCHGDARDGVDAGAENEVGLHGNAVLSRWPLRRAETFSVAITKDKFESSEKRLGHKKALWAEIDTPLGQLAVVAAHLDPYASPGQRRAQMRDVTQKIAERALGPRVLLGGDFNTSTYDLGSLPRLAYNIALKLARGGVPHAIDHYMRPHELYERGIFEELAAAGFDVEPFNDMKKGSVRYEVGTFDSESKVRDHLPGFMVGVLRRALRPWGGVAPLKIDWFAGRGLRPLGAGELEDGAAEGGRRPSLAPTVLERARFRGEAISDHDPVLVDVGL